MNNKTKGRLPLLKLKTDIVFKAVFATDNDESKALLIRLLNLVLDRKADPIKDLVYKNPFTMDEPVGVHDVIFDILVTTDRNEKIDVEMQMNAYRTYPMRAVFYQAKMISQEGLERGSDYDKMKKTEMISFVDGILFRETERMHTIFRYAEEHDNFALSENSPLIHFLELPKLKASGDIRNVPAEAWSELERLCILLKYAGVDGYEDYLTVLAEHDGQEGLMKMTERKLEQVSADEKMRIMQDSREKFLMDQYFREKESREDGIEEGRRQGMEQGLMQGDTIRLISQIKKKIARNLTADAIADALEEPLQELQPIYDLIKQYPDESAEQIYERLQR